MENLQVGDMVRVTESWLRCLETTNPVSKDFKPHMYGLFFVARLSGTSACDIRPMLAPGGGDFLFGFDKLKLIHRKGDPHAQSQTAQP